MSAENKQQGPDIMGSVLFVVGLIGALVVGWVVFPQILYSTQNQPINYNHALHQEDAGMSCEDCHFFREDGTYAGKPTLASCIECHEEAQGETEAEAMLVSEYIEPGIEIPWLSYTRQPDNVFFSHAAHAKMAEMKCMDCHRDVEAETAAPPVRINRLTGYPSEIMKMHVCEDCHAKEHVSNACDVCHR